MPDARGSIGEVVTGFVADLTGRPRSEPPSAQAEGADWLAALRQWLARQNCGLVTIANPGGFSWPGHWIGIVQSGDGEDRPVAVLLFGTPSAVVASPSAPELVGRGVEELRFRQGLMLVPFDPFIQPPTDARRRAGEVAGVYISTVKTGPMRPLESATAIPGKGLEGDRYAAGAGTFTPRSDRLKGYDLTLIESEVLAGLTLADGGPLGAEESRRNILTTGVDLNALVGQEFLIGSVRAFGQRLCEPCVHLQRLTRPGVVAGLAHRGGLRADLLTGGEIRVGDRIEPAG